MTVAQEYAAHIMAIQCFGDKRRNLFDCWLMAHDNYKSMGCFEPLNYWAERIRLVNDAESFFSELYYQHDAVRMQQEVSKMVDEIFDRAQY